MPKQAIDIAQFSEVIATIYDCAVDPQLWPSAIQQVSELVHGINGVIMMVDTVTNQSRFYQDWNVDRQVMQTYAEKFHADNPLNDAFPKFDVDEPYNVSMVMEPSAWLASKVYQDFGRPNGWLELDRRQSAQDAIALRHAVDCPAPRSRLRGAARD